MFKRFALMFLASFFLAACATVPKIDPMAYPVDKGPRESVPKVCKSAYEGNLAKVAVVNFTNNSTFDYANVVQSHVQGASQRTAVGGAAVGVVPGAAGVVWGTKEKRQFQRDSEVTQRQVNAKLSESVEDGFMDELVNMGGAKVFTRKEMEKIISEHKFQRSGLVDESTLVRLGKFAGVKYIITGSINNVDLAYKTYDSARQGLGKGGSGSWGLDLLGSAMAAGLESQEGWNIGTELTMRILDVETGEVLFSDKVQGKHIIGKIPYPNYDALVGGIKKAASKGLEDSRPKLSKWFTVKGYIRQLRTSPDQKERFASLSVGEKLGVKPGTKMLVYAFEEMEDEDPVSGNKKITCNIVKLPVEITVTDQVQPDSAWVTIEGKPQDLKRVKVGQMVERQALGGQGVMKKMGY
ncbi:MAG: CsgG/HfaB family protein [Syntrophales bacterium LBB04]|nr:CsgG/HfaB family protein [Syntrophales bacterium LBB04]